MQPWDLDLANDVGGEFQIHRPPNVLTMAWLMWESNVVVRRSFAVCPQVQRRLEQIQSNHPLAGERTHLRLQFLRGCFDLNDQLKVAFHASHKERVAV